MICSVLAADTDPFTCCSSLRLIVSSLLICHRKNSLHVNTLTCVGLTSWHILKLKFGLARRDLLCSSRFGFFWSHTSVRSQQDPIQAYQLNRYGIWGGPSYSQNTDLNINVQRKFRPIKGNPRQSWILNFTSQIPDSCRLDQWNLASGFQLLLGFRILWVVSRIPRPRISDSTSKNFPVCGIRTSLHEAKISNSHAS